MAVKTIDHGQLRMPPGGEPQARAFYRDQLGIPEIPKPPHLAVRGGCWFESNTVKIHVGVEQDFRPMRRAHPGLIVDGLPAMVASLTAAGYRVDADQPLEGFDRVYVDDPFGNRIELMQPK